MYNWRHFWDLRRVTVKSFMQNGRGLLRDDYCKHVLNRRLKVKVKLKLKNCRMNNRRDHVISAIGGLTEYIYIHIGLLM